MSLILAPAADSDIGAGHSTRVSPPNRKLDGSKTEHAPNLMSHMHLRTEVSVLHCRTRSTICRVYPVSDETCVVRLDAQVPNTHEELPAVAQHDTNSTCEAAAAVGLVDARCVTHRLSLVKSDPYRVSTTSLRPAHDRW